MTTPGPIVQNFLDRLDGVRQSGGNFMARCPCRNDDSNPSLSVSEGTDGRVLVHCHRGNGCDASEICASVGLTISDIMPQNGTSAIYEKPIVKNDKSSSTQQKSKKPIIKEQLKFVCSYDYLNESGELLFQKVRYVNQDGIKTFRQRKPLENGEWSYSLSDVPKILYNLPSVLAAKDSGKPIWVVEGEKDVDTLTALGHVATTMPGGAGHWLDIHTEALAGATVDIIADNDAPGMEHAARLLKTLTDAGCDVQAWICPNNKDITDHLSSGGTFDELNEFVYQDIPEQEQSENIEEEFKEENNPVEEKKESVFDSALIKIQDLFGREDLSAGQMVSKMSMILSATTTTNQLTDPGRLVQWNDFISEQVDDSYDWVIPGLLERGERVIVVAAEGVGKTMLARQVALCAAAGVHPFTYGQMKPVRTLTVDLENPERIIRRASSAIVIQAMKQGHVARIYGEVLTKPSGMDLLKPEDRLILEEAIERVRPEILVMGPLYKSFVDPGGRTSEAIAVEVAKYLDTIRTVYGCALWLEHHAPLGTTITTRELRPFGSAVWSRWPEFGISLQPDPTANEPYVYDVRHFRGARDQRQWPLKIKRGKRFPFEVIEYMKTDQ